MWMFIGTIVVASLLGSMHCVGMCGPLAMWASGVGQPRKSLAVNTSLYHVGRLLTYGLAGALAGFVGQLTDIGGRLLGLQSLAAQLVGSLMVAVGVWKLIQLWQLRRAVTPPSLKPSRIGGWLVKLRPLVFGLPAPARALTTGLLTALLPCGWIYLFALVAAGTGNVQGGLLVMVAFWLGSVPALVALVASATLLTGRLKQSMPLIAAGLLIVAGSYTAVGRGYADLDGLTASPAAQLRPTSKLHANQTDSASSVNGGTTMAVSMTAVMQDVDKLLSAPLPCCQCQDQSGSCQPDLAGSSVDGH